MILFPKLFNHGTLRNIKVGQGKVTFEGTNGKAEFVDTGSSLPEEGTAGQVLTKYGDEADQIYWADVNAVPAGGTMGQVLTKYGEEDDDYMWDTLDNVVPSGGTTGQVLAKKTNSDFDTEWVTPSGGGGDSIPEITVAIKFNDLMGMTIDSNNCDASQFDPTYTGDYRISLKFTPDTGVVGKTISDYTVLANYVYYNSGNNEYEIYFPATYIAVGNIGSGNPKLMFARTKIVIGEGPFDWYIQSMSNTNVYTVNA